jgi:3-phosphoshikimate 1-carboxyvinyltransferase
LDDGIAVSGPTELRGAAIDSYGDHRIAMAFSVAALIARGETQIKNPECVGISFPEFFGLLDTLAER